LQPFDLACPWNVPTISALRRSSAREGTQDISAMHRFSKLIILES
jgi:hypothetical protein